MIEDTPLTSANIGAITTPLPAPGSGGVVGDDKG
jgi:hypothetical protein